MNVAFLRAEPGVPDFIRRLVTSLREGLRGAATVTAYATPDDLPRVGVEPLALAWVRSIGRLAIYDGAWIRTDTGATL